MRFEACSKEIYTNAYKKTDIMLMLDEFLSSGLDCVRIVDHKWANAKSGYSCIHNSIKRFKYGEVKVFLRDDEIYLVRTNTK